jgi:hypothetical protein
MLLLLGALLGIALTSHFLQDQAGRAGESRLFLTAFLFGLPLLLAGGLLFHARWTLMACVIYGTVGLALDISTVVYDLTHSQAGPAPLALSAASGLVNFLLIIFGGRGFLDVGPAAEPQAGPPPSPRSPSSS